MIAVLCMLGGSSVTKIGAGQALEGSAGVEPSAPVTEPQDPRVLAARRAFLSGTDLARDGKWRDALAAFERAASIRPHPVTTYNIAYCERALGHVTRAHAAFGRALADHEAARDGLLPPDLFEAAREYVAEAEARLARVVVTLRPADARVAVDGRPLEAGAAGIRIAGTREKGPGESAEAETFELWADPGMHVVILSRSESPDRTHELRLAAGPNPPVTLAASALRPPRRRAPRPAVEKKEEPGAIPRGWPISAYTAGGLGLVTGAVFGLRTLQRRAELDRLCGRDHSCPARYEELVDTGHRDATISTVGFAVAGAGAALGSVLVIASSSGGTRGRVGLVIGPSSSALVGRF